MDADTMAQIGMPKGKPEVGEGEDEDLEDDFEEDEEFEDEEDPD